MSEHDVEALRSRVEATAERLTALRADRRRRNRALLDALARLEEKFAAQEHELAYYRGRVEPLEAMIAEFGELAARLLDVVDAGLDRLDDPEDGVQRAIAVATAMLERDLAPPPGTSLGAAPDGGIRFDDAPAEALAAEAAADREAADLPEMVRAACRAAAADPAAADTMTPSAEDIRALLERVEAAAGAGIGRGGGTAEPGTAQGRPRASSGVAA